MKPKLDSQPDSDSKNQVEAELKRTRKELETTKNALKHQVARCRHLVSAFSKKLAEKDSELRVCKETREKQLSAMIRALLVLEARLRREQKCIRTMLAERDRLIDDQQKELAKLSGEEVTSSEQSNERTASPDEDAETEEAGRDELCVLLAAPEGFAEPGLTSLLEGRSSPTSSEAARLLAERDAVIAAQQAEIAELRSLLPAGAARKSEDPCYAQPDLISSLRIDAAADKSETGESSESAEAAEAAAQPDSLSSDAASTRACLGDADSDSLCNCTITPPVVRGGLSVHDRSAFSPVPRSAPKFEETPPAYPPDDSPYSSETQPIPRDPKPAKRSFDINYQDNPVLQCVNQILLKDPDDIMEDQRSNKLPSIESPFVEIDDADQQFWLSNGDDLTLEEPPSPDEIPQPAAASSPSEKCNGPESESRGTQGHRLSLSKLIELHNAVRRLYPRRDKDGRKSVSLIDLSSVLPRRHPPGPPKQQKSSPKKVEFEMDRETDLRAQSEAFTNPKSLLPPQPVFLDRNKLDILAKPSPLPFANTTPSAENPASDEGELYVISNSALDDEILQKIKGKNLKSFEIKLHRLAGEAMLQQQLRRRNLSTSELPSGRPALSRAALTNVNLLEAAALLRQLREASRRAAEGQEPQSIGASQRARLRVAASVAQLLAQAREQQLRLAREQLAKGSEAAVQSDLSKSSPSQSQRLSKEEQAWLVREQQQLRIPTEAGGSPRPANPVPGASSPSSSPPIELSSTASASPASADAEASGCQGEASTDADSSSSGVYDNFLEATGLSQKSIMTPSRMLNNHRNVIKPKDVKLRNKVRNAAIFERNIPPQVVGPTVKYWTEPFL